MANKNSKIIGSEFGDVLTAPPDTNSRLYGLGGNDIIKQSSESLKYINRMYGGSGDDEVNLGANTRIADGGDGNDRIVGHLGSKQRIYGGNGNDYLETNVFYAGKALKNIVIDTGDGDDELSYWNNSETKTKNVKVYAGGGNDKFYLRPLRDNDNTFFDLGPGDDVLVVAGIPSARDIIIYGGDGYDVLDLSGGWDRQNYLGLSRDVNGMISARWTNYVDKNGVRYIQTVHLPDFEAIQIDGMGVVPFSSYPDLPII